MIYIFLIIFLFSLELIYFKSAKYFNIIDEPNERSLHSHITIRGGGVVFWSTGLTYFFYSDFRYPFFIIGLCIVSFISLLDDIFTISNLYRIPFQFIGISLLLYQFNLFESSYLFSIILLIIGVGIVNAYNFMDGINGITGGYSIVIIAALLYVNNFYKNFIDNNFIIFVLVSLVIFNFFNFRKNAVCFAGDVGSISIAFIILFLIMKISILDNNPIYILFLGVYGVDSVLTIMHRIILKQNIFKAHRIHLFQVIVYNKKIPHLLMSSVYMIVQTVICWTIINSLKKALISQLWGGVGIIFILVLIYILVKYQMMKQTLPFNN